ncbi:hypothetical protein LTR20_000839 [Exophiala xenobiotica]|nr:hypothetical protein LTR79_006413 [Exophiala xenobiotica]KAK5417367.1 hypothetical protein LTR06_003354 [Exophiala xenobiotica]KAK5473379.1 hypothetical protein LTR20_000839 [Exophiala xenobiotica]
MHRGTSLIQYLAALAALSAVVSAGHVKLDFQRRAISKSIERRAVNAHEVPIIQAEHAQYAVDRVVLGASSWVNMSRAQRLAPIIFWMVTASAAGASEYY